MTTTVQEPIAARVAVGTRVRHRPTGAVGTIVGLPTRAGTASIIVRFDEPDEYGYRVAAVLWHDLERVVERTPDAAAALADDVDESVPYVLAEPAPAPSALPVWVEPPWVEESTYEEDFALLEAAVATLGHVESDFDDEPREGAVTVERSVEFVEVRGQRYLARSGPLRVRIDDGNHDMRFTDSQARELAAALTVAADRADAIARGPQETEDGRERP